MRVPDVIPPPSTKEICSSVGHSAGCAAQPVSLFFYLSRNESCQSVRKGNVKSLNGCDSGLKLELEEEKRNSKYDLERRGSVCFCKSKQELSLDDVELPFDSWI
ncbi:hypothetical protein AVEN_67314-1 [Araneus ventricosus]|uniref:Uncharacterized protein n=1 Tax=Araneus ventricosus TaxID=182803 RepID=A0A4Y2LU94_ARAVE|nr:hypothetical protein AVEN_67314-1 [Araneus ventricosus]